MSTLSEAINAYADTGFTEHFAVRRRRLLGLDGGSSFEAHEVVFVIAFTFQDLDPLVSDQHQQNVGLPNSLVDLGHEIDSWKKRVDIQKDIILVIMFYQDVAQTLDA